RFTDERGAAVDPFRAKARVLLELSGGLCSPHGEEALKRSSAQLHHAPFEQKDENRSRYQEGEKQPEQEPRGEASPRIEALLEARDQSHEATRAAPRSMCIENDLF